MVLIFSFGSAQAQILSRGELQKKLTVSALPQDFKLSPGKGQLGEEDGQAYAELLDSRGVAWQWPREKFVPGLDYRLIVRFGHVGALAEIPCQGLILFVWNASASPMGTVDQAGNLVNVKVDCKRLKAIGGGQAEEVVATFQPAEFDGSAHADFQVFVAEKIQEREGTFPRIFEFRFEPVLEGKSDEELKKIALPN